ncbi:hypothetical protein CS0771_12000 [Catellatospora sp. IY07-71]|uniref:hypothetical protein n=1 Tax=Catellatospora sp. IY07-71 TaxID=2728827 RepID=UPI001BB305C3|nr:hypothetical protein [Catellatospora sp. IY07-71]BCJ71656.1 hypothetical protein CS0771_12000 [Catellatospora sp. IY07-71]
MRWDDPSISDSELLYRRVPVLPDFFQQADLIDGSKKLSRASFQFDDDGISVYRDVVLKDNDLKADCILTNSRQCIYGLTAADARRAGVGVIEDVDREDLPRGLAHALLVCSDMPPSRSLRRQIGDSLCAAAYAIT